MSKSDAELVQDMFYRQANAREYSYFDLPGYSDWATRKLDEGVGPEILGHLEAFTLVMLPDEAAAANDAYFDEALDDLRTSLGL
ncbi:hypothetical protein AX777_20720 [Sphingobium yanoikuyae]|uniref:Uncharacterized protein n=1 Tax=Sphingobium yanoikuyae TaxID=13690 RepID=A0A177JWI7_SPHYA|nr:hypothetical protein [Sphingobium yanoikuyae]OAH44695.1 hypothetical protein AX777_20720 [Sphingobium yanoikuyae]